MGLAPKRQPYMGIGIATGLFFGGLIDGEIARGAGSGRVLVAQHCAAEQHCVDHGAPQIVGKDVEAQDLLLTSRCHGDAATLPTFPTD